MASTWRTATSQGCISNWSTLGRLEPFFQGGAPTKLRDHARACAVSPDGTRISFATNKGTYAEREIWFMGPGGEQAQRFYEAREGTGIDCWGWSPDGKYYGYILADKSGDRIFSQAIEGGSPVELFGPSETKKMNDIVWLHDGRVVYVLPESESSIPRPTHWQAHSGTSPVDKLAQPLRGQRYCHGR